MSIGTYSKHLIHISPQTRQEITSDPHSKDSWQTKEERPDLYQCNAQTEVHNSQFQREKDARDAVVESAISRLLAADSNDKDQFVVQSNEHIEHKPKFRQRSDSSFNSNQYH